MLRTLKINRHLKHLQHPEAAVREKSAINLGLLNSSVAIDSLIGLLSDESDRVRAAASKALISLGCEERVSKRRMVEAAVNDLFGNKPAAPQEQPHPTLTQEMYERAITYYAEYGDFDVSYVYDPEPTSWEWRWTSGTRGPIEPHLHVDPPGKANESDKCSYCHAAETP